MKRILIFSLVYYPRFVGGAEVAVKEITDRAGGIAFDMVTIRAEGESRVERIGAVTVHRVSVPGAGRDRISFLAKYLFIFAAFWKASRLDRKNRYDAIWSIMANYAGFAAVFFKMAHPRTPFILTLQEGDPIPHIKRRVRFVYPLFKRIFLKADRIQAISQYLAGFARDMGATCPVSVVPNGVDLARFSRPIASSDKADLRKACGFAADDTVLVTASRLVAKNAVGDIIESLAYLSSEVKLLVLGTGHLEDELRGKAEHLGLGERVKFLGFADHAKLPAYLAASDVFIRPSLSEGLGNSFLEAMAAGIPVIATPVGGIPDFLKDGETGLFCEVKNPKSIAQKVEKLLRDKESRDFIVKNAARMVKESYGWEKVAGEMKEKFFIM